MLCSSQSITLTSEVAEVAEVTVVSINIVSNEVHYQHSHLIEVGGAGLCEGLIIRLHNINCLMGTQGDNSD